MKPLFLLSSLPFILAFSFSPMSQTINLGEKQKGTQFLISNESQENVAVELTVKERIMSPDGKEITPDTKDVSVFPPQMIIPAKEKRTVRVQWNGSKELKTEKAFRVIAEQLPVKVDERTKKKSGIQMLMRYVAALYVTPEDAESKIKVRNYTFHEGVLKITLENEGNKHQVLFDPVLTFKGKDDKFTLKPSDLVGMAGENILANNQREFTVKTSKKLPTEAEVSLKIND